MFNSTTVFFFPRKPVISQFFFYFYVQIYIQTDETTVPLVKKKYGDTQRIYQYHILWTSDADMTNTRLILVQANCLKLSHKNTTAWFLIGKIRTDNKQ